MTPEFLRMIKQMIRKEIAQMMLGNVTGTDDSYVGSQQRFATDSEIDNLRVCSPFGFVSRPPAGTPCVVAPINGDPSHLVILNQFDTETRPTIEDTESAMYGPAGQLLYLDAAGDIIFTSYSTADGTIQGSFQGKITQSGNITFQNTDGGFVQVQSGGAASIGNSSGSVAVASGGMVAVDGGGGASHGVALGDVAEMRVASLEMAVEILTTALASAAGSPVPPGITPFIAVPTPIASETVTVST